MRALIRKYREIILYIVFGAATTAVNWIVYTSMVRAAGVTVSNGVAWFAAVSFAFVTNKLFVFESRSLKPKIMIKEILTFFGSRALSGILDVFGPSALIYCGIDGELFGIKGFVAKLIVSVAVICMNYVLSKLVVFKKREK
ncbi:MAG: GtrA family protein [Acutalibacteraceae bacterium]